MKVNTLKIKDLENIISNTHVTINKKVLHVDKIIKEKILIQEIILKSSFYIVVKNNEVIFLTSRKYNIKKYKFIPVFLLIKSTIETIYSEFHLSSEESTISTKNRILFKLEDNEKKYLLNLIISNGFI